MNVFRLVVECILIIILGLFIATEQVLFGLVLAIVWLVGAIQSFLARKRQEKYMAEKGYKKRPIYSPKYLIKKLKKDGLDQIVGVYTYTLQEFRDNQAWADVVDIYEQLKPQASHSSLGTGNVIINTLGGFLIRQFEKSQEGKTRLMVVALKDGKYFFAPMVSISTKKLNAFYGELQSLQIPVYDEKRTGVSSFRLSR